MKPAWLTPKTRSAAGPAHHSRSTSNSPMPPSPHTDPLFDNILPPSPASSSQPSNLRSPRSRRFSQGSLQSPLSPVDHYGSFPSPFDSPKRAPGLVSRRSSSNLTRPTPPSPTLETYEISSTFETFEGELDYPIISPTNPVRDISRKKTLIPPVRSGSRSQRIGELERQLNDLRGEMPPQGQLNRPSQKLDKGKGREFERISAEPSTSREKTQEYSQPNKPKQYQSPSIKAQKSPKFDSMPTPKSDDEIEYEARLKRAEQKLNRLKSQLREKETTYQTYGRYYDADRLKQLRNEIAELEKSKSILQREEQEALDVLEALKSTRLF